MANREQLKKYAQFKQLCDDPMSYAQGCRVVLFPNGEKGTIWVSDKSGRCSMQIEISCGKAGLGVRVKHSVGTAPITISGNQHPDYEVQPHIEMNEVSCTQYFADDKSQAFKAWHGLEMRSKVAHDLMETDALARQSYQSGKTAAQEYLTLELAIAALGPIGGSVYGELFLRGWYEVKAGMHDPK